MSVPQSLSTNSILMDLRDRMARIETKLDAHKETSEAHSELLDDHDTRLKTLENDNRDLRQNVRTLKWVGGAALTVITFFSDHISKLFH